MKQKENLHLEKKDHSMLVKEFKTYNKKCPSKSKKKEELRQRRFQTETKNKQTKEVPEQK